MIKNRIKMKKQIIISALGAIFLASCADEFDHNYEVGRPDRIAEYAYLNDYQPLKEYVTNDNFKLGIGTTVSDYMNKGLVYALVNSNFTETVAGNAMKMGSIVKDNGDMDFGTVKDYVSTATDAGLSVYGHTLAWHAQQPAKWLNSLIADKDLPVDPNASNNFLELSTPKATDVSYGWQIYYVLPTPLKAGTKYVLTMRAKAENPFKMGFWPYKDGGATQYLADPQMGEEWTDLKWEFTASDNHDQLQWAIGFLNGKLCLDDIKLTEAGSDVNLVNDGNFNEGTLDGWRKNGWHGDLKFVLGHEGAGPQQFEVEVKRRCIEVNSDVKKEQNYETQFWIMTDHVFKEGDKWEVSFDCRANMNATSSTQVHKDAGAYLHYEGIGTVPFTLKWNTYEASGTIKAQQAGGKSIAFNLNDLADATSYYFDNISFKINGQELVKNGNCEGTETANFIAKEKNGAILPARIVDKYVEVREGNSIPLTDEEKKDTLIYAMDKWISGMMEACDGKVKAWDVVNEAISGADKDGDGKYDLQHESDNKNDFFWQNYLGDLDYVRTAVKLARKYGPEDVKLFINDYNLESDWDNNGKLKSLIQWIKDWEADGVTKIDGIGTQMHISYYLDPKTQESKQKAVENAFKLMAESGKLVRISELDMGLVDADGNDVATALVTEEQHKAMAAYYTWIIKTYLSVIPAAQQWGITQWCATDSPADSGWRANSPVGLWDKDYYRKHTYAGFADGLSGK